MSAVRERRVRRVYRYRSGLMVMTFEDGQDAILFDPARLALWTFDFASEAFEHAERNKIPMGDSIHVTESLPRATGVGQAVAFSQAAAQSFQNAVPNHNAPQMVAKGSGTATDSKKHVRHDSPENFVPIDSIALL